MIDECARVLWSDERIRTIMAIHDGIDLDAFRDEEGVVAWYNVPDYLTSHDAIQRVLDKMPDETADAFLYALEQRVTGGDVWVSGIVANAHAVKASPRDKCWAALVALGATPKGA